MHSVVRLFLLVLVFASPGWAQTAKPTLVVVPLEVDPNPAIKKAEAGLRAAFFSTIDLDGSVIVVSRRETDLGLKELQRSDFRKSNEALGQLASTVGALYGLYASLEFTPKKELVLTAHVVREDGVPKKSARVQIDKGADSFLDLIKPLTKRLIEQLELNKLPTAKEVDVIELPPKPPDTPRAEVGPPPPPPPLVSQDLGIARRSTGRMLVVIGGSVFLAGAVVSAVGLGVAGSLTPVDGSVPRDQTGTVTSSRALKTTGLIVAGAGAACGIVGAVLWATAPAAPAVQAFVAPGAGGAVVGLTGVF